MLSDVIAKEKKLNVKFMEFVQNEIQQDGSLGDLFKSLLQKDSERDLKTLNFLINSFEREIELFEISPLWYCQSGRWNEAILCASEICKRQYRRMADRLEVGVSTIVLWGSYKIPHKVVAGHALKECLEVLKEDREEVLEGMK
ncbi:MAG: hypothetical protein CL489_10255 [Acidobacteria bacterium]|nr:hypothetical protein [Acidobacteriota bacterium]|tara:strand:+ start:6256 stop:6684 length:429 start_codon:yes stop_codon:yes gene_type:complete